MALILIPVCNICRNPGRSVETYEVKHGDDSVEVAFCEEHDHLLEHFTSETLAKKTTEKPTERPARRRSTRSNLGNRHATLAEIEASKP